ncbi:peroxiredoxin family protein [Nitrospinae bacterium AH_259_B05_G02_I21]|nr:peroxiredoxin family protein [Nitrospinae bacterium AH_259_B05_G02_I21]MDA2932218.1 peroxiredoxin family protein [Nitrospinae bacterium AH-259-F20]
MADFQGKVDQFNKIGTQVVALSVDSEEDAQKTVEGNTLTYPVLYGLDAREMVSTIGAYINEGPLYLHATGFILRSDGTIVLGVYSSGAIGRLVAEDTIGLTKHYQQHGY